MKQSGKKLLWRGLSGVACFSLCFSMIAGVALETNAGTIDTYLGTHSEVLTSENNEENPLYDKFNPPAELLNEDGTGNSKALITAAMDLGRREVAEGSVLLKNNGALPLASGSNVTLLGIRSHKNLLGSNFGVGAKGVYVSLEQALSQNRTDFAHTIVSTLGSGSYGEDVQIKPTISEWKGDEFDFEGAGFNLNPTMIEIYETLGKTYPHAENEGAMEVYNPGEPSVEEIAAVNGSYQDSFAQYGDAAIVVIARPSCESHDYLPGGIAEGLGFEHDEPLSLTQNERDAIEMAKKASDKVIVLISSSTSVEIGTLKNDPDVDAIMWIGAPGCYGMLGVADILCGRVSPSGGLFDIFTAYNMSAPAMQNMGQMYYSNTADVITRKGGVLGFNPGAYAIEAEGLYAGYRYYETRYYDSVAGTGNATSPVGAYGSTTEWNYDNEVTYGFGYGLSYTDFDLEMQGQPTFDVTVDPETGAPNAYATFNVKVTNTGKVPGKTPVQIYGQAPYIAGGVEKVAVQLLNFDKSSLLAPGESEIVPVKVDLQYIASYDESYENADGTTGAYIMDPGSYYFAVGNGAHDALNNIMVAQGMDAEKMVGTGDASKVFVKEITEDFISKTLFSVSKTGYKISNQLPYADWNYYQPGEVTYLTRTDWAGTFPKHYGDMTLTNEQLIKNLNGETYTLKTDDDTSDILWGPGLNTHRHAYNGRNGEYYSEDPILSGVAAMEFSIGALNYGLVAAPKHFAFNDQETERGGISPYMTEQRARELELRAYQYAFEATKYDTPEYNAGMRGLMTSFSKIGSVECTTSEGLMTEILANEWGFIGYAVTDIYDDVDLWSAVLNSGTTCFDTRGESGFYGVTTLSSSYLFQNLIEGKVLDAHFIDGDANLQRKLKEAVHKNIYAWTESHLMNRYNATTHIQDQMTWWRATYYAGIGVSGVVLVLSAAMYVLSGKRKKEEE